MLKPDASYCPRFVSTHSFAALVTPDRRHNRTCSVMRLIGSRPCRDAPKIRPPVFIRPKESLLESNGWQKKPLYGFGIIWTRCVPVDDEGRPRWLESLYCIRAAQRFQNRSVLRNDTSGARRLCSIAAERHKFGQI